MNATDETVTISTCAACKQPFEDETDNLHEFCGECEPLHDCARCGHGLSAAYGDNVPDGHVDVICDDCTDERTDELARG